MFMDCHAERTNLSRLRKIIQLLFTVAVWVWMTIMIVRAEMIKKVIWWSLTTTYSLILKPFWSWLHWYLFKKVINKYCENGISEMKFKIISLKWFTDLPFHFSGPLSRLLFLRRDLVCGFILLLSPPERLPTRPLLFLGLDSPPC